MSKKRATRNATKKGTAAMSSWEQEAANLLKALCEYNGQSCECPICDAAFAIECLVKEVETWRTIATNLAESNPSYKAIMLYHMTEYRDGWPL